SEQVPGFKTLVCLRCLAERIFRSDRHLQFCGFDSGIQALELTCARDETVKDHLHSKPRLWNRVHPIQICDSPAAVIPDRSDATLKGITSGESQHSIDSAWRKALCGSLNISSSSIYDRIGAQTTHEC